MVNNSKEYMHKYYLENKEKFCQKDKTQKVHHCDLCNCDIKYLSRNAINKHELSNKHLINVLKNGDTGNNYNDKEDEVIKQFPQLKHISKRLNSIGNILEKMMEHVELKTKIEESLGEI